MGKDGVKTGIESSSDLTSKLVVYIKSNDIRINASDLRIEFSEFKEAVKNSLNVPIVLGILSVWLPLVTSDFRELFGIKKEIIQGGYYVVAFIVSLIILKPIGISIQRFFIKFFLKKRFPEWLYKNENDPEIKTNQILNKCRDIGRDAQTIHI